MLDGVQNQGLPSLFYHDNVLEGMQNRGLRSLLEQDQLLEGVQNQARSRLAPSQL